MPTRHSQGSQNKITWILSKYQVSNCQLHHRRYVGHAQQERNIACFMLRSATQPDLGSEINGAGTHFATRTPSSRLLSSWKWGLTSDDIPERSGSIDFDHDQNVSGSGSPIAPENRQEPEAIIPSGRLPRSAQSSRSPSLQNEDSFSIYTSLDGGFTAAIKRLYDQGLNPEDLPANPNLPHANSQPEDEPLDFLLRDSLVTYGGPDSESRRRWLPIDRVLLYVRKDLVCRELHRALGAVVQSGQLSTTQILEWAESICQISFRPSNGERHMVVSRQKIFAILTLMGRIEDASAFIDAGLTDMHLPLSYVGCFESYEFFSYSDRSVLFPIALKWQANLLDLFDQYQDYMLSPFFELRRNEVPFYDLYTTSVLPFIEEESDQRRLSGLHGTVYRVRIHPAHHDLHNVSLTQPNLPNKYNGLNSAVHKESDQIDSQEENPWFAVKELTAKYNGEGFQKEVEAWRHCAGVRGHAHLIKLLAVWRQNHNWYLLQPWADGNLWDFWQQHSSPHHDLHWARWIISQILGLAQALRQIHRRRSNDFDAPLLGIHGDIKPENILWFKGNPHVSNTAGRLVICDFGFTSFHTKASISNAATEGNSTTYKAPEFGETNRISRAYDMWSLGCVYLEFITWYLTGYSDVRHTFAKLRLSDDNGEGEVMWKSDKFFNRDCKGTACMKGSVQKVNLIFTSRQ